MEAMNQESIRQLLERMDRHYISPLTKVEPLVEALTLTLLGRPLIPQVATPSSWRFRRIRNRSTREESFRLLWTIDRYLDDAESVFARDKRVELGHSFPYFEWNQNVEGESGEQIGSFIDFLGDYRFFYLNMREGELLESIYNGLKTVGRADQLTVFGGKSTAFMRENHLATIAEENLPFLKQIGRSRGITMLFNQSVELIIIDPYGKYVRGMPRSEVSKNLELFLSELPERVVEST